MPCETAGLESNLCKPRRVDIVAGTKELKFCNVWGIDGSDMLFPSANTGQRCPSRSSFHDRKWERDLNGRAKGRAGVWVVGYVG